MLQIGRWPVVGLSGCACKMHGIGIESVTGLGAYFRSLVHVSAEDDAVAFLLPAVMIFPVTSVTCHVALTFRAFR